MQIGGLVEGMLGIGTLVFVCARDARNEEINSSIFGFQSRWVPRACCFCLRLSSQAASDDP